MLPGLTTFEECPLQHSQCKKKPRSLKGPLRVVRLCVLGIVLPTALVSLPLYLRYHVYISQLYPFAVSDMRLLDRRVSTVWCQKQLVKLNDNTTFNAFLLSKAPHVAPEQKSVSMVRDLLLKDDMKEYWGFYLLSGSTVTVSTCVRWPGASLIVIRGHKHLYECAYIGDDSSEELDEVLEAIREGVYVNTSDISQSNAPHFMKRHRPDVLFHHPVHHNASLNHSIRKEDVDASDVTDPKLLKNLLDTLSEKTGRKVGKSQQLQHRFAEQNGKYETPSRNEEREATVPANNRNLLEVPKIQQKRPCHGAFGCQQFTAINEINENVSKLVENLTSSEELYREVVQKLEALGDRKHKVLRKLNNRVIEKAAEGGRNAVDEDANRRNKLEQLRRRRRDLIVSTAMAGDLNANDQERDAAVEEGFNPDGIAEHRGTVNETTPNDRSNSEFWSSFSSSEEALLNCAGLILNLPLTPHSSCEAQQSEEQLKDASLANTVTYVVPTSGYYFFVFNSENEVQVNYIRVRFQLNRTVYDVSHPVSSCANSTGPCALDLRFFSDQSLVMEVPVASNESRWNEEFVVVSECQPRTLLYVICVLSVPVLIMMFAFQ